FCCRLDRRSCRARTRHGLQSIPSHFSSGTMPPMQENSASLAIDGVAIPMCATISTKSGNTIWTATGIPATTQSTSNRCISGRYRDKHCSSNNKQFLLHVYSPQKYTQHLLSGTPAFHDHAHVGVRSHAGAASSTAIPVRSSFSSRPRNHLKQHRMQASTLRRYPRIALGHQATTKITVEPTVVWHRICSILL